MNEADVNPFNGLAVEIFGPDVAGRLGDGARVENPATPNQIGFINRLLAERETTETVNFDTLTKRDASKLIDRLLAAPKKANPAREHAPRDVEDLDVPDGYYAVEGLDGYANEVNFFKLDTGKADGRWEGFRFLTHIVAGGHDHPIKGRDAKLKVFNAIRAQGVNEARARYGQEIGRCGVCGRELTDDESRALGIGPVCREGF